MTISLTPFDCGELCHGNTWSVEDEGVLADQIARVAVGQARHVAKILAGRVGAASNHDRSAEYG
jgi:hypothetical protein